jgi:hypothetical protein
MNFFCLNLAHKDLFVNKIKTHRKNKKYDKMRNEFFQSLS